MDRRHFLKGLGGVATLTVAGGGYYLKNLYARNELENQLLWSADATLAERELSELRVLPNQAKEEIRVWFHEPCLDADLFAASVSSETFLNRLHGCETEAEQHNLFLLEFLSKVTSAEEIHNRILLVAEEIGEQLDWNWAESCRELASSWELRISAFGESLPADLSSTLDPIIRQQIDDSLAFSAKTAERPTLLETASQVGESAILMLPLAKVAPQVIPLFIAHAVKNLFDYFVGLMNHPRDRIRRGVSSRLSLLANRIALEFESEVTRAIARLHEWQRNAVNESATKYADSTIPWYRLPA